MPEHGDWRLFLCDRLGNALTNVTPIARERKVVDIANGPRSFGFVCRSNDSRIAGNHTDGLPKLTRLARTLKAFRFEHWDDGTSAYRIRFAGPIWSLQDVGDEDSVETAVTAFDPLMMMTRRFTRGSDGDVSSQGFNYAGEQILRDMVDRTNTFAGYSGLTTVGGAFDASPTRIVTWNYKYISEVVQEFTGLDDGFDVRVDPLDGVDGYLGRLSCLKPRGIVRPDVVFSWKLPASHAKSMTRSEDSNDAVNVIYAVGASGITSSVIDNTSVTAYGRLEATETFADVADQTYLAQLGAKILRRRSPPEPQVIEFEPIESGLYKPWDDFETQDTCSFHAPAELRGGFTKTQRLFGWALDITDEGTEKLVSVATVAG